MKIKTFIMIPRRQDIPPQEFHDHWRHPHASWGSHMTTLLGYVQSHQFPCNHLDASQSSFEGVAEAWFADMDDAASFRDEPILSKYLKPDEPKFIDMERLDHIVTKEEIIAEPRGREGDFDDPDSIWSPWTAPTSVKLLQFVSAAGNADWAGPDDKALGQELGALRHVRCHPLVELYGDTPHWRGVRELQWPTLSAFNTGIAAAGDAFRRLLGRAGASVTLAAKAELFIDPSK